MRISSGNLLIIDEELRGICRDIIAQHWLADEWADREADDWFQTANYRGGFDATEMEFCFSVAHEANTEWWFQFSLDSVEHILSGEILSLECRKAN